MGYLSPNYVTLLEKTTNKPSYTHYLTTTHYSMKMLSYILFKIPPHSQPPFSIELGIKGGELQNIDDCAHIPDAIEKMEAFCSEQEIALGENLSLLYPIYMEAMNGPHEMTMHSITWTIKENADKKGWQFNRIGGLTGRTTAHFLV